ncbi:hypothetical protein WNY37_16395 [Henriciella sp. AS95]|uniref:hypothetical protein n=1 Tax=Henriciella sp. AS95 TaxID=3135782 RepID=UPI00316D9119
MGIFRHVAMGGLACLGLGAGQAAACSCPPSQSAAQQAEGYDLIAVVEVGEVWDLESEPTDPPSPFIIGEHITQMKVQRVLKGEMSRYVLVKSADAGMPACGVNYRPDTELLLLAKGGEGVYSTWMCDRAQFPVEDFEAALDGE